MKLTLEDSTKNVAGAIHNEWKDLIIDVEKYGILLLLTNQSI